MQKIIDFEELHRQEKVLGWNVYAQRAEFAQRAIGSFLEYKRFITIEYEKIYGKDSRILQDVRKKKIWYMNRNILSRHINHKHRKNSVIVTEEECIKFLEYKVYESAKYEMSERLVMAFQKLRHHLYCDRQIVLKRMNKPKADLIMDIRNTLLDFAQEFGCSFHGSNGKNLASMIDILNFEDQYTEEEYFEDFSDDKGVDCKDENTDRKRRKVIVPQRDYITFKYEGTRPKIKLKAGKGTKPEWSAKIREESEFNKELSQKLLVNDYERVTGFRYVKRFYPSDPPDYKAVARCIRNCPFIKPLHFMLKRYGWPDDVTFVTFYDFELENGKRKLDCGCVVDHSASKKKYMFSNKSRDVYKELWEEKKRIRKELDKLKESIKSKDNGPVTDSKCSNKIKFVDPLVKEGSQKKDEEIKINRRNYFERLDEPVVEKVEKTYAQKLADTHKK